MDTGPREGDIYFENHYTPGTPEWYDIEKNNAIYRQRFSCDNNDFKYDPKELLIYKLILQNKGKTLDETFCLF